MKSLVENLFEKCYMKNLVENQNKNCLLMICPKTINHKDQDPVGREASQLVKLANLCVNGRLFSWINNL